MGKSYIDNGVYIAELDGGRCRTYAGFIKELNEVFAPSFFSDDIHDINYYIFSDWKYPKEIIFKVSNIKSLRKNNKQYNYVLDILESWKEFHEEHDGFSISIIKE